MGLDTDGRWGSVTKFRVPDQKLDDGHGHTVDDKRGLFVIHAVLLYTGKVLLFGGHAEFAFYAPVSYEFDPKDPTALLTPIKFPGGMDLFCCYYVQLHNGRVLVVGGSDPDFVHHGSRGAKNICTYNPDPNAAAEDRGWRTSRKNGKRNFLHKARWYPTAVMMPDQRVLVVSGRPEHGAGIAIVEEAEILEQGRSTRDWSSTILTGPDANKFLPTYPGLHLVPDGKVYHSHTTWGWEITHFGNTHSIEVADGATTAKWKDHSIKPAQMFREEAMSVLLPPAQDGKILVVGGALALRKNLNPPPPEFLPTVQTVNGDEPGPLVFDHVDTGSDHFSAEILDTKKVPPAWTATPGTQMQRARTNGHCVLLPDETVLIAGGHNGYKWQPPPGTSPTVTAEIFTPGTGFKLVAPMDESRMYHSVALLLPDGRVFVAGGANPKFNEDRLTYPTGWQGPVYGDPSNPDPLRRADIPLNQKTFQIYEPPYFFQPDRASQPVITDVRRGGSSTQQVRYGQVFTVVTPQAATIKKVSFMRPGAPTHHTDTEQRYVKLEFTAGTGELTVTAVADAKLAPAGYYMLWIVDDKGRPCQDAKFIHLVK
jgi:hypothetical protein